MTGISDGLLHRTELRCPGFKHAIECLNPETHSQCGDNAVSIATDQYAWDYSDPHVLPIRILKSDIDGMGHANNACYVVWCEQCAWNHSEFLGLTIADYQRLDRGVAIRQASYEYFLPTFENEDLVIGTWLTACDEKFRLERRFQMINVSTGQTVQRGHWQLICVTLSTGKVTKFPKEFIERYGKAVVQAG